MKKIKLNILKFSLSIMGLVILFLMSCQSSSEKKTNEEVTEKPDSVVVNETQPLKDTIKPEINSTANKPKPVLKDSVSKPKKPKEKPVMMTKYGVRREIN